MYGIILNKIHQIDCTSFVEFGSNVGISQLSLQEIVDNLRAEIATARFSIQAYKNAGKPKLPKRGPIRM